MDTDMVSPCVPWVQRVADTENQARLAHTILDAPHSAVNQTTSQAVLLQEAARRQCRKLLDSNIQAKQETLLIHVFTVWHCAAQLAGLDKRWTESWAATEKQRNVDIAQRKSDQELDNSKVELREVSKKYRDSEVKTMKQTFEDSLNMEKEKLKMAVAEMESFRCALQEEQKTRQERQAYHQKTEKLLKKIDVLTSCDIQSPKPSKVKNQATDFILNQLHQLLADVDPRYLVRSSLPRVSENSPPWSHTAPTLSDHDARSACTLSPNSTRVAVPPHVSSRARCFRAAQGPNCSGAGSPGWISFNVRSSPHIGVPRTRHVPNALQSLPPSDAAVVHSLRTKQQQVPPHLGAQLSPRCPRPPLGSQTPTLVQASPFCPAPTLGGWPRQANSGIPITVKTFTQGQQVLRNGTSTATTVIPAATGGDTSLWSHGIPSTACAPAQNPKSFPTLHLSPTLRTAQLFHSPRQR